MVGTHKPLWHLQLCHKHFPHGSIAHFPSHPLSVCVTAQCKGPQSAEGSPFPDTSGTPLVPVGRVFHHQLPVLPSFPLSPALTHAHIFELWIPFQDLPSCFLPQLSTPQALPLPCCPDNADNPHLCPCIPHPTWYDTQLAKFQKVPPCFDCCDRAVQFLHHMQPKVNTGPVLAGGLCKGQLRDFKRSTPRPPLPGAVTGPSGRSCRGSVLC